MARFIIKHINNVRPQKKCAHVATVDVVENKKEEINEEVMTTSEKVELAKSVLATEQATTKRIKKDKGLIERTESSKTILTEDNKELLKD